MRPTRSARSFWARGPVASKRWNRASTSRWSRVSSDRASCAARRPDVAAPLRAVVVRPVAFAAGVRFAAAFFAAVARFATAFLVVLAFGDGVFTVRPDFPRAVDFVAGWALVVGMTTRTHRHPDTSA